MAIINPKFNITGSRTKLILDDESNEEDPAGNWSGNQR